MEHRLVVFPRGESVCRLEGQDRGFLCSLQKYCRQGGGGEAKVHLEQKALMSSDFWNIPSRNLAPFLERDPYSFILLP